MYKISAWAGTNNILAKTRHRPLSQATALAAASEEPSPSAADTFATANKAKKLTVDVTNEKSCVSNSVSTNIAAGSSKTSKKTGPIGKVNKKQVAASSSIATEPLTSQQAGEFSKNHEDMVNFVSSRWQTVMREYAESESSGLNKVVVYKQKPDQNKPLPDSKPFDVHEWWGSSFLKNMNIN